MPLLFIMSELLLFYFFPPKRSKKIISYSTIILKIFYLIFGFLNYFVFWILSFFLVLYVWFLGLLSKYSKKFDAILIINFTALIFCAFFSAILLFQVPLFWILLYTGVLLLSSGLPISYISRKRQALSLRQEACEAFKNKEYSIASQLLKQGIDRTSRMSYGPEGYIKTDLRKLLEKEVLLI